MSDQSSWTLKGVEPEAREAAKIAARRAGLSVGEWLSHTIRAAAAEQLRRGGRPHPATEAGSFSSGADGDSPPAGAAQPPAPTMHALFESIQKLSSRIEAAEMKTAETIAPLAEQVESLAQQVAAVKDQKDVGTAPVERAVNRLADRLQKLEQGADRTPPRRSSRWSFFGFTR